MRSEPAGQILENKEEAQPLDALAVVVLMAKKRPQREPVVG
jgi:hypothetical protein